MENYDLIMQEEIKNIGANGGERPSLLLHACCAVCSSYVIACLRPHFELTVLYYNPNIEPMVEYEKRKSEQLRLLEEYPEVRIMDTDYENESFKKIAEGLENEPEGGARCSKCIELRLSRTAELARDSNSEYFCSTLSVSPHKNAVFINSLGKKLQDEKKVKWLCSDFKKRDGFLKSNTESKRLGLYRQDYCGCIFSKQKSGEGGKA